MINRNFTITVVILLLPLFSIAQKLEYATKVNIPYYNSIQYDTNEYAKQQCKLDIYYPLNKKKFATVIWFHGGGLSSGTKEIPQALMNKGFAVVGVGYRLSPNVVSPTYIEDAAAAVAWVYKNMNSLGGDSTSIFLAGHSAGGYLISMVGLDKQWLKVHGVDANSFKGLISLSGQCITHFAIRKEMGIPEVQPIINSLAPLFHIRKDAPPLLLITGDREKELLGRYEENAYMFRMMKVVGHKQSFIYELKGLDHNMTKGGFPILINFVNAVH